MILVVPFQLRIFYASVTFCFITSRPELARPATTLYQHNLTGILETAVRATNAQFDNPEILKRLDVRLLEVSCIMVTLI